MKRICVTMLFGLFCTSVALAQQFVTQNGAGSKNGSSWANAYDASQLQLAITTSSSGGEVWVAAGTYVSTTTLYEGTGNKPYKVSKDLRDRVFLMKRGVSIYGGFAGSESSIDQRAFNTDGTLVHKTILSGDINGDDVENIDDPNYVVKKMDNAYHVIMIADGNTAEMPSVIDGFTIQGGYADGIGSTTTTSRSSMVFDRNKGGGITVRGGGAYNVKYRNLTIANNEALADTQGGGGIYFNVTGNNPFSIERVSFKNNRASYRGGAMYINRRGGSFSVNISDSHFQENRAATNSGGAICYVGKTTAIGIYNSIFKNNTSNASGGAIYMLSGALTIENSLFDHNSSDTNHGGAVGFAAPEETMQIKRTKFLNNTAGRWGGAVYLILGTGEISSSVFYNNKAKSVDNIANGGGGAIFLGNGKTGSLSKLTAVNNTFYNNNAVNQGGAISFNTSTTSTALALYNNIFNGNTASAGSDVRNSGGGVAMLKNNLFQENPTKVGSANKTGNIYKTAPRLFASTTEADYNFLWPVEGGVSVDKGTETDKDNADIYSNIATETDLLGNPRKQGMDIDLGAIEWSTVLPVK